MSAFTRSFIAIFYMPVISCLTFSVCTLSCLALTSSNLDESGPEVANVIVTSYKERSEAWFEDALAELIGTGWRRGTAKNVLELNRNWFGELFRKDKDELKKQLFILRILGSDKRCMELLQEVPEIAGLLASVRYDERTSIVDSLATTDRDFVLNLYALYPNSREAILLADVLKSQSNRFLIKKMHSRGILGAETLFMFDRHSVGGRAYGRWLKEVIRLHLDASDEEFGLTMFFLLYKGRDIRKKMVLDKKFREEFPTKLWPKLERIAGQTGIPYHVYVTQEYIWNLLALPEGEQLAKKWGPLAIELLFGKNAYNQKAAKQVIQALLLGNESTIQALYDFRAQPLFRTLITRNLRPSTRIAAIETLYHGDKDCGEQLQEFARLSDIALQEEVGTAVPPRTVSWIPLYCQARKLYQGRSFRTEDWIAIGGEVVTLPLPTKGGGKVFKVILKKSPFLIKNAERKALKQLGKEGLDAMLRKGGEPQLVPWVFSEGISVVRESLWEKGSVDMTNAMRMVAETSSTFGVVLKLISGTDIRILLDGDAKVIFYPMRLAEGVGRKLLKKTVKQSAKDKVTEFVEGVNSNDATHKSQSSNIIKERKGFSNREWNDALREHVAAWWLMHARGLQDHVLREHVAAWWLMHARGKW